MSQPSIKVGCQEGFDGGLPQTFLLEVYENEQLKTKMTNQKPFFEISQVDINQAVKLFVFAQNAKGSSEPFIIEETFGKARQQAVEGKHFLRPIFGPYFDFLLREEIRQSRFLDTQ